MADISPENASECITAIPNTQGPHTSTFVLLWLHPPIEMGEKNQHITPDSTLNQAPLPEVSLLLSSLLLLF